MDISSIIYTYIKKEDTFKRKNNGAECMAIQIIQ